MKVEDLPQPLRGPYPDADITPAPHFDPPPEVLARVQALRDLAARWEATPPAHHTRDGFTASQAPTMLRRLAAKLASPDPAVAALGAEQIRGVAVGWHDKASPAALLWGEAVALLPGDAPTVAPAESPAAPLALVMAQAYERGRAKGREEERASLSALDTLANLIARCKCAVTVTINDHRTVYQSVAANLERERGIDPEMMARMVEADTIVHVQFYPSTPVGFYSIYDVDLAAALTRALACMDEEGR